MRVLGQGGPKAAVDASAHAREAGVGDSGEAKLGGGTSNLFEVRSEERLPRCGCGRCWVRSRHCVMKEVGEAGRRGGAGCQNGQLEFEEDAVVLYAFFCAIRL